MKVPKSLFYPRNIAVIGASNNPARLGYTIVKNLRELGYQGQVYPINPKLAGQELLGYKAYSSIKEVPDEIDVALIVVGARLSLQALKECAEKGVKSAIVFSAGFSEIFGEGGRLMELEMKKISEESGMLIIGPNCLGVLSAPANVYTFPEIEKCRSIGEISAIFQSGSLIAAFAAISNVRGFYLNKAVNTGNEAAATLNDFLEYFIEDSETRVIALYIEQVRDSRRFIELCKSSPKPIVALKVGASEAGRIAAKSHTAAVAGSIEVWNAVCKQAGIIQASTFEELYDLSMALVPPLKSKYCNVGIVTAPGGPSVIAADTCGKLGLSVPKLSSESVEKLRGILPPYASLANPIDMTASALEDLDLYKRVLDIVLSDRNVDVVLVITPLMYHLRMAKAIAEVSSQHDKPVVVAWTGLFNIDELLEAMRILGEKKIPNYFMPERAVKAIAAMRQYVEYSSRKVKSQLPMRGR